MNKEIPVMVEPRVPLHQIHRICWSAVFAGAFVGLGLLFLLHLYGVAISLSVFNSANHGAAIAIGGFLGMVIGVIAAMVAAGFVTGYLGRFHYYPLHGGVIYGFVTWSLIIFLSAIMIGPMQRYVLSYGNALSNTVVMKGEAVNSENEPVTNNSSSSSQDEMKSNTNDDSITITTAQQTWTGWIVFVLFFVGALSSCIGATCGMHCKREYNNPTL